MLLALVESRGRHKVRLSYTYWKSPWCQLAGLNVYVFACAFWEASEESLHRATTYSSLLAPGHLSGREVIHKWE